MLSERSATGIVKEVIRALSQSSQEDRLLDWIRIIMADMRYEISYVLDFHFDEPKWKLVQLQLLFCI